MVPVFEWTWWSPLVESVARFSEHSLLSNHCEPTWGMKSFLDLDV